MSSLAELIKSINDQIDTVNYSYVYYDDDTKKIIKISNKLSDDNDVKYIKIETELVNDIIVGKKRTDDFIVTYDLSEKRMTVKELSYESELDSVKFKLYKLPTVYKTFHPTLLDNKQSRDFNEIYKGIHVDVWYKNLEHLAGQHVWIDNTVYRLINNQPADTDFDINNAVVIVENVLLFNDQNKNLKFEKKLKNGNKLLSNNKLYVFNVVNDNKTVDNLLDDVKIKQNLIDKCWEIELNKKVKKELVSSNYSSNDVMYFSVTQKDDPNILYRSLEFNLGDLLLHGEGVYPFEYEWEIDGTEVSVYTPKYFKTYVHEVIN